MTRVFGPTAEFPYVARWSEGDTELIKETGERVIGCAKGILQGLEAATQNEDEMEEAS